MGVDREPDTITLMTNTAMTIMACNSKQIPANKNKMPGSNDPAMNFEEILALLDTEVFPIGEPVPVNDISSIVSSSSDFELLEPLIEETQDGNVPIVHIDTASPVAQAESIADVAPPEPAPPTLAQPVFHESAVTACREDAERARRVFKSERRAKKRKHGDGDVPEEKCKKGASMEEMHKRRLHLNRESAAASRASHDFYVGKLEKSLSAHEFDLFALRAQYQSLQDDFMRLSAEHRRAIDRMKGF